ncbi:MAG: hypothetical protein CK425_03355 [Parachlamydia sp.]|nr:MAG: hypothetical protein CK425_03355 [Parachlamydia sp.]
MAIQILNPNSKNFEQDLHNILTSLNTNKHLTLSTKLSITNRNNLLWGAIKCFLVKVLKCKLSLTRNEDVAKALKKFAQDHAVLFDPMQKSQNVRNYKEIFAKAIQIKFDAPTGQAIRDPKANKRLKRCYDLFDLCLNSQKPPSSSKPTSTPKSEAANLKEALEYLKEIEKYPTLGEKISRASLFSEETLRERYTKIIASCPFNESNLLLLKDFSLLLKQYQFSDLHAQLRTNLKAKNLEIPISEYYSRVALDAEIMQIQRTEVPSCFPADDQPVECLVLKGTDGKYFGVKILTEEDSDIQVIKITQDGKPKEVCVSQKEFSDRLLLNSLDASFAVMTNHLSEYLKESNHILALKNIQRITEKQQRLGTYSPEVSVFLNEAICQAFARLKSLENAIGMPLSTLALKINTPMPAALKTAELVFGFRKDKIYVRDLANKKPLVKGGEAEIFLIKNPISGKDKIMKFYDKYSGFGFGSPFAAAEVGLLEKLYEGHNGKLPGLIKPFHGVVNFVTSSANLQSKYLGNLYEILGFKKDVAALKPDASIFTCLNEKLEAFDELLSGFEYCVTKHGLIHQDVKSLNILVSKDAQGKAHLHLGDLGSAVLINPNYPAETIRKYDAAWSSKYLLLADLNKRMQLGKNYFRMNEPDSPNFTQDAETYFNHCKSLDVFALGCVFTEFIAPGQEYMERRPSQDGQPNINGHPLPGTFKRKVLNDAGCPSEIIDLIEQMVDQDPLKRPSIQTVAASFKKILTEIKVLP